MIKQKILSIPFVLLLTVMVVFTGCDSPFGTGDDSDTGTMEVMLHDAPADYEAVNVFIERIEVNNAEQDTGWVEIGAPQQSYNLLELTNGAMAQLGDAELETGTYEQIRLILSEGGHNVVIDGESHDMFVPSGPQTGIKLNVNAEIEPGITYTLLLDFDANRSVVERGNQQQGMEYLLKPVIRATNEAVTGNIAGVVEPVEAEPFVYAIANDDTLSSTKADTSDGSFMLVGLEEGSYTVSADPANEDFDSADTTDVEVTVGETNDVGTISLSAVEEE